jgi:hypothetical protein
MGSITGKIQVGKVSVDLLRAIVWINENGMSFASRTSGTRGNTTELVVSDTRKKQPEKLNGNSLE